jgi:hypothetical protein
MPSSVKDSDIAMHDAPANGDNLGPSEAQSLDNAHGDELRLKIVPRPFCELQDSANLLRYSN